MLDENILIRLMRGALIESYGDSFEKLFGDIMRSYNNNFTPIRPYGNIGDMKNDGYIRGEGIFFQVYGPMENTSVAIQIAKKKIREDFEKLKTHSDNGNWEELKQWIFVYNDKTYNNIQPLIYETDNLTKTYNIPCCIWGIGNILDIFAQLPYENKKYLCGMFVESFGYSIEDRAKWEKLKSIFHDTRILYNLSNFILMNSYTDSFFIYDNIKNDARDFLSWYRCESYEQYFDLSNLEEDFILFSDNFLKASRIMGLTHFPDDNIQGRYNYGLNYDYGVNLRNNREFEEYVAYALAGFKSLDSKFRDY